MDKAEMFEIVKNLPFDIEKTVYQDEKIRIYLFRPSKLAKRFQGYNKEKNFQIGKVNFIHLLYFIKDG